MAQHLSFEEWLKMVESLADEDFEYFTEWYSWKTAYDERLTPMQAYRDCKEWMNS
jgi:hypothetical protein